MSGERFHYQFDASIQMSDVEASFVLSIFAVEALHGEAETRLHAEHALDLGQRTCVVDASTPVGRDLNRLFVGFLRREFGDDQFHVRRLSTLTVTPSLN